MKRQEKPFKAGATAKGKISVVLTKVLSRLGFCKMSAMARPINTERATEMIVKVVVTQILFQKKRSPKARI